MKRKRIPIIILLLIASIMLAACGGSDSSEGESTSTGSSAIVDGVTIDLRNNHHYAIVTGTYPDPCTRISDVQQEVDGESINISLLTDRPDDLVCAQMISPYGVDLLIQTGGLLPGEYLVDVNGVTTNFTLGE